jgi:hypothetical protein
MHPARRSELTGLVCNRLDTHATPGSVKLPKKGISRLLLLLPRFPRVRFNIHKSELQKYKKSLHFTLPLGDKIKIQPLLLIFVP